MAPARPVSRRGNPSECEIMSAESSNLIDALPGASMPVAAVPEALARMWDVSPGAETGAPSAFRALQMNLILHFGVKTSADEARAQFDTAVEFGQHYPCRIIVLCPEPEERDDEEAMKGKLFSQCYIGPSHREMCCCEALILGYGTRDAGFLEDQVSIWLEGDLPVYYRVHRVPTEIVRGRYLPFLRSCSRVVYDSAVDGSFLEELPWPRPGILRDLAWARILPLRQSLGNFLSGFDPGAIVSDLRSCRVRASAARWNEAQNLMCWMWGGVEACRAAVGADHPFPEFEIERLPESEGSSIEIAWRYTDGNRFFRWRHNAESRVSILSANLTGQTVELPLPIRSLAAHEALAEALFF